MPKQKQRKVRSQRREKKYLTFTEEERKEGKANPFRFAPLPAGSPWANGSHYELIGGKDACTGDSGAPLWVEAGRGEARRAVIIGVVSRGFNCASNNAPGIYVRVKKIREWIRKEVNDGECAKDGDGGDKN